MDDDDQQWFDEVGEMVAPSEWLGAVAEAALLAEVGRRAREFDRADSVHDDPGFRTRETFERKRAARKAMSEAIAAYDKYVGNR